jgi:hypothetical protein
LPQAYKPGHFTVAVKLALASRKMSNLETVKRFSELVDSGNFEEAGKLLADDMKFTTPKATIEGKEAWLKGFPAMQKAGGPTFSEPEMGAHEKQVTRKGKAKLGFLTMNVVEVVEFNDDGKMQSLTTAKA